jgi:hypothetical protein
MTRCKGPSGVWVGGANPPAVNSKLGITRAQAKQT